MIYEKEMPKKQVSDEARYRRITYYRSDIDPYPLRAQVHLHSADGQEVDVVDILVDSKLLTQKQLDDLSATEEKVWKGAAAQASLVAKS